MDFLKIIYLVGSDVKKGTYKMHITILNIIKNKDGSETWEIEYDRKTRDFIKKHYKRKRMTKKLLQKFIIEALEHYSEKEPTK
jgi:hypothetical protein